MTITKLIEELKKIEAAKGGEIEVVTYDYAGGGYDLNDTEPRYEADHPDAMRPVVVMTPVGRY